MRLLSVLVLFSFLVAVASPAMALDPIPQQPGFSGYVRPGIGGLYIKDNMVAKVLSFDLSDKRISDLGEDPNSQTSVLVTVPFNLAYTFAGSRTQIFLGTDVGDLLSFDTAQQLGIKQEIGAAGLFQAGVLFSGNVRVWKDPYVTGQNRDDTSRRNVGFQVGWDKIFGSNLELEYSIRSVDIGHEKSGQFLGLPDPQQDRLDRNGTVHQLVAGYGFKLGGNQTLRPEISVFREDLEGDAMANTGVDLKLTYIYDRDPFTFIFNGYVGVADYDKSNPIYGKTQEDTRFGSAVSLYYTNPWGWTLIGSEPMRFFGTVGYYGTDSNIDFYNQEAALVMGGIAFRWK